MANISYPSQISPSEMFDSDINPLSLADLTIESASLVKTGDKHSLSVSYANIGGTASRGVGSRLYWSQDAILDSLDKTVRTNYVPPIAANSVFTQSQVLSEKPRSTDNFLIIFADSSNITNEGNESNNTRVVAIPGRTVDPLTNPDLNISGLSVANGTNLIMQGYGFVPKYTLNNSGNALATASTTRYVLSKDAIIGNADDVSPTLLNSGNVDADVNAGSSRLETNAYMAIYDNLTPGVYNFYAIADSTNAVTESNETNNVTRITVNFTIPPKPDLVVEDLEILDSVNVGSYLNLSYTIRNIDTGYVGYTDMNFYLSADNVIDASDVNLGRHMATASTPSGVPISRIRSLLIPTTVSAGAYNLIAQVDANGTESNENNNTLIKQITINSLLRPDLSVTNLNSTTFSTGSLVTIPYTIANNGGSSIKSTTNFYLSTDATFNSTSDLLLGTDQVREIGSQTQRLEEVSLYLNPSSILNGTNNYYLIASSDHLSSITETSETNNITVTPVTVTDAGATRFSSIKGYGVVNAASSVARALNLASLPDVPSVSLNWGINMINAPEVWNAGYTGAGITVAVIDTGVDYNHPDLVNNIWSNSDEIANNGIDDDGNGFVDDVRGWDFVSNDNAPSDSNGHGTHVAGIIAASRNSIGHTGVAYNAKIMPLKALGGGDEWGNIINAIRYAVDNGARVINMSLGGATTDQDGRLREVLQYAADRGVIAVSAAGNSSSLSPGMPARFADNWGIAVGAASTNGAITSYSNRAGSNANMAYVMAPESSVSTLPNNRYGFMRGTSMATPHVAGVVALMLEANPSLTDGDIREILTVG